MERGVVFGCNNIYGFTLQGGKLIVKPEQAAVVREVYRRFLMDGKGTYIIARELTAEGIPQPSGKGNRGRLRWCCGCSEARNTAAIFCSAKAARRISSITAR